MSERVSVINESTATNGVVIDGCTIKDSLPRCSQHSWEMHSNATLSLTSGAITQVPFNLSDWDPSGIISLTDNNLVVPATGKYFVNFMTKIDDAGVLLSCYFYVDGASAHQIRLLSGPLTARPWDNYATILDLTAGDVLDVRVSSVVAGVVIGSTSAFEWSRFHGFFIG